MSYVALYRKFRPAVFEDIKGQDHVVRTLRNQVITGRLQHAYLFCGTRGTGKTSAAKILARAANCENPVNGNPCGVCRSCRSIADNTSMNVIEIDAASNNGVDNIREIIEEVQYHPADARYKVYIIDEVHMLSAGAFNALLKTLEEPPSYVIFILATTEAAKVPVTILSRCQRFDFHRLDVDTIVSRMREMLDREGVDIEDKALRFVARSADGAMRDAWSLMDRCLAFYMGETITYDKVLKALGEADMSVFRELTELLSGGIAGASLKVLNRQIAAGAEVGQFVTDYIIYLRNLLVAATSSEDDAAEMIDISREQMQELQRTTRVVEADTIMRFIRVLSDLQNRMRFASNRRVLAEVALLQMAKPQGEKSDEALRQRMSQLEAKLETLISGGFIPAQDETGAAAPEEKEQGEFEPLPDAAPDDLRKVMSEWKTVVMSLPSGLLKQQLREDAHPQFKGDPPENRLYVEFGGGHQEQAALNIMNHDEYRVDFERFLEKRYGKHIDVEFHLASNRTADMKSVDLAQLLTSINMQIETVPDEIEEL